MCVMYNVHQAKCKVRCECCDIVDQDHALSCSPSWTTIIRYDVIRNLISNELDSVFKDVVIDPYSHDLIYIPCRSNICEI
ncbi:hypothetical protein GJ496_005491 [Pomphorhynchus laevis]|nr:hypothetical protein GJ496_005491 [Pomphorhynchus laevis]